MKPVLLALWLTMTSHGALIAQQPAPPGENARLDSLRAQFRLPEPPLQTVIVQSSFGVPAASLGSPTAFGASGGDAFVGAGYQKRTRYVNVGDGAVSGGFGIGNARVAAMEVTITSFSTLRQGFGTNGSVSVKLHRLLGTKTGVAVGYENAVPWGGTDGGQSLYLAASHLFALGEDAGRPFGGIGISLGVGNARFRSEAAVRAARPGVNVFGSASVRVLTPVILIADWTGQDLNVGLALQLPERYPVSFSLGFADLTGNAGDGARFIAGAGATLRLR